MTEDADFAGRPLDGADETITLDMESDLHGDYEDTVEVAVKRNSDNLELRFRSGRESWTLGIRQRGITVDGPGTKADLPDWVLEGLRWTDVPPEVERELERA